MTASLALVLALDASASVSFEEFALMANGIGAALRDPAVAAGLTGGTPPGSQCALLLWSGAGAQDIAVPWMRIRTAEDVAAFADAIENAPRSVRAGKTAIGEALLAALTLLSHLPEPCARLVVDVIGDGRSNDGIAPGPVRDRMVDAGITINGLCILNEEPDLLDHYRNEVIGGPDCFAVTCAALDDFVAAVRRKLLRETAPPIA